MLEALRLHYKVHPLNILEQEQFEPGFLKISPNSKIPAILDDKGPNGETLTLFESGTILLYLAEKSGEFIPPDPMERLDCIQWKMDNFGPFLGQAHQLPFAVLALIDVDPLEAVDALLRLRRQVLVERIGISKERITT